MRIAFAMSLIAATMTAGSALAQTEEISLAWYEDNWEATTFPSGDGAWDCSVDSLADNYPDFAGAWVFVFPSYLQFSPNEGLPDPGAGRVSVDNAATFDLDIFGGQAGFVADEDDLPLLQALANGQEMTIEVWPTGQSSSTVQYVYSLNGFREAYLRISAECQFDPSMVLDSPTTTATSSPLTRTK